MQNYLGFTDNEDLARQFGIAESDLDGYNVLIAVYDTPAYEGYAFVLMEKDGQLYEVNGSHCSCYGLEGQWDIEETCEEALKIRQDSEYKYGAFAEASDMLTSLFKW